MIVVLIVFLGICLIGTWLLAMYIWWKQEQGLTFTPVSLDETILPLSDKMTRIARRKWYLTLLYGKKAASWNARHLTDLFYAIFPSAKAAFAKRDALTGLKDGPSSYFLKTISEKDKKK